MSAARRVPRLLSQCLQTSTRTTIRGPTSVYAPPIVTLRQYRPKPSKPRSQLTPPTKEQLELEERLDQKLPEEAAEKFTTEQWQAIRASERSANPRDLRFQGKLRDDPYRPNYMEDYTELDPRFDLKPEVEGTPREHKWLDTNEWIDNYGQKMREITDKKTSDQITRAMVRALRRVKESSGQDMIDLTQEELEDIEKDPELIQRYIMTEDKPEPAANATGPEFLTRAEAQKLDKQINAEWEKELDKIAEFSNQGEVEPSSIELMQDGPAGVDRANSAEAPELGKVPGVEGLYKHAADPEDEGQDDAGKYQEIKRLTGLTLKDIQSLLTKPLVTRWVSNQTRLGKIRSTSVVAIAGNGNGRLGLGMAKSTEPGVAEETAQMLAIRNMKPIRRYENRTVYGNIKAKVSGTVVEMYARPPGFGLRVPHRIFEMCRAAGIHDIAARMPRSKNPMNSVKAAYKALTDQPDPEQIAIGRGKKLVDARKVYYGGSVY